MANLSINKQLSDFSVVIIEYLSSEHLIDCLDSIFEQTHAPKEIVVVVNAIEEKFELQVATKFPNVHLVHPEKNIGYSAAANLGIANTSSDFIFVLNPDTKLEKDVCEKSIEYLQTHPKVGSLGPKILESNGEVYPSARREPSFVEGFGHALLGSFFPNNRFSRRYKDAESYTGEVRESHWLSGAALFLRREALDEVGGWDEDFFMYCEDIDLGRRLKLRGWKNVYFPEVSLTHIQGVSTSRTPTKLLWQHHRSLYIYASKKYNNNVFYMVPIAIFIAIRFPIALVASKI